MSLPLHARRAALGAALLHSALLGGCGKPSGTSKPTPKARTTARATPKAPPAPAASAGKTAPAAGHSKPTPARRCPKGEVYIPATGAKGFTMGRALRGGTDEPHKVVLTKGYCLDQTEVTVAAYRRCVEAGKCELPWQGDEFATYPRFPDHPVNMVSWHKARAYCGWRGQRLPTEAEWEWAARGTTNHRYPWGDEVPTCEEHADFAPRGAPKSNPGGDVGCDGGGPSKVASHKKGARNWPDGPIYDLGGNVWEWVEDAYLPYGRAAATDPLITSPIANRAIRGGGWNRPARAIQSAFRGAAHFRYQVPGLGFRCARSLSPASGSGTPSKRTSAPGAKAPAKG